MTEARRLYIDFDDVLCETARALIDFSAREFGKRVPFEEIEFFDLRRSFSLTADEAECLSNAFHDGRLLASLDPVPGAVEGVRTWRESGSSVWVVTGRPPDTYEVSADWLARHGVPYDRLVMVDKYARNHTPLRGVPAMTLEEVYATRFRLAVEDSLDMAGLLLRKSETRVALLARPWNAAPVNASEEARTRLKRCRDWEDVTAHFPAP